MRYQIFGSETSVDIDVMVFVDEIPIIKDAKELCKSNDIELSRLIDTDKEINSNIAVVKDGICVDVFKGTIDEVNNSLIDTYDFHEQYFPQIITSRLERDVKEKAERALRIILSLISRTQYRPEVKQALKSDVRVRYETLLDIDLETIIDMNNKNVTFPDYLKSVTFQIYQTIALKDGIELYTKEDIIEHYPESRPYLERDVTASLYDLNTMKLVFLSELSEILLK